MEDGVAWYTRDSGGCLTPTPIYSAAYPNDTRRARACGRNGLAYVSCVKGWVRRGGVSAQGIGGVRGTEGAAQTRTEGPGPERADSP
jgi:hypothetical protein